MLCIKYCVELTKTVSANLVNNQFYKTAKNGTLFHCLLDGRWVQKDDSDRGRGQVGRQAARLPFILVRDVIGGCCGGVVASYINLDPDGWKPVLRCQAVDVLRRFPCPSPKDFALAAVPDVKHVAPVQNPRVVLPER